MSGDRLTLNTEVVRTSKSGPRSWTPDEYKGFDYGYKGIDWSKKGGTRSGVNPAEVVDPDAPVCELCSGKSAEGDCAACD